MFEAVAGNFFITLIRIGTTILDLYIFIIIGRAIISWVNADPYNPIVQFIYKVTEPPLAKIRQFLPPLGGLDLSPMVLIFAIILVKSILQGMIMGGLG
jgi:YggT family protein